MKALIQHKTVALLVALLTEDVHVTQVTHITRMHFDGMKIAHFILTSVTANDLISHAYSHKPIEQAMKCHNNVTV